ncbi:MAG: MFS transporter [Cyanobacteria bacterium SBLK]|nr:MFS transporter [Cyanobacteria bacterium SBLK]
MNSLPEKLSFKTKFFHGFTEFGLAIPGNITSVFFLFFLTNIAGLNPVLAGSVLLIGRVWDAINDPLIGWLSDRTQSRWGKRYPWIIFGIVPLGISIIFQWVYLPTSNQWLLFSYYSIAAFFVYLGYTAVLLPSRALTSEFTRDYNERTSLTSFKSSFSIAGSLFSFVLAELIFDAIADPKQKYFFLALVCAVLAIISVYLFIWGTYPQYCRLPHITEPKEEKSLPFAQQLRILFQNRAFLILMGIYLCSWLAVQWTAAILPYFVVNWMGLSEQIFLRFMMIVLGSSLGMMFLWNFVSQKTSKKFVYFLGMPLWAIAQIGLIFLQPGQMFGLYGLAFIASLGVAIAYLVPWAMLPDVIDLDELKSGQRRDGIFYGFLVQLQKLGVAVALFIVGIVLDWSGFIASSPENANPVQPELAIAAIRWMSGGFPALALIAGLILTAFYPISREVHNTILLQLAERRNQTDR